MNKKILFATDLSDNLFKVIFCITLLSLFSCEPNVYFKEAQPRKIPSLTSLPLDFRGVYRFASDSSLVRADDKVIAVDSYFEYKTRLSTAHESENCKIANGGIYLKGTQECIPYEKIDEDLVRAKIYTVDTLFSFSQYHVAKMYGEKLLLSYGDEKGHWLVNVFTPIEHGAILWEFIDIPDKTHIVEGLAPSYSRKLQSDSSFIYIIDPNEKGFRRIFDKGYLTVCDTLKPFTI